MIFGIGTDIVRISRMEEALLKNGDKFAQRILTDDELNDFAKTDKQANFLAKRFAAKEAAAKAMGTGFRDGLSLKHIGVGHDDNGKPVLCFSGKACEILEMNSVSDSHVSLADEQEYAVAFVTLVKS